MVIFGIELLAMWLSTFLQIICQTSDIYEYSFGKPYNLLLRFPSLRTSLILPKFFILSHVQNYILTSVTSLLSYVQWMIFLNDLRSYLFLHTVTSIHVAEGVDSEKICVLVSVSGFCYVYCLAPVHNPLSTFELVTLFITI